MNWIQLTAYGTLLFSGLYILLSFFQMQRIIQFSKSIRLRGLEYYQFLVPFRSKKTLEKNYLGGGPESDALFHKLMRQRSINALVFFLAFSNWLAFLLLIQFG
ncbi:MAG: hypothetical protein KTR13_03925 [Saprospiraceae bacterium]|nr:hypothetical protein [Saprospiraceae bacterium]